MSFIEKAAGADSGFRLFAMAMDVVALQAMLEERRTQAQAIADNGEERDLTDEEVAQIEALATEVEGLSRRIAALKRLQPAASGGNRLTGEAGGNANANGNDNSRRAEPSAKDKTWGFKSLGHQAAAIRAAVLGDTATMTRLRTLGAATTYGNEGVGADGAFLLAPQFAADIAVMVAGEDSLAARCDNIQIGGLSFVAPKDESAPWDQTDGIAVSWEGEGSLASESKPAFKKNNISLNRLTALVKCTDELLQDATALDSYLRRKTPMKFVAKMNSAIVRGNGVGMPLGIMNAPGTIAVAEETSQVADTIVFENIVNMSSRHYVINAASVVWLINQNTLPQLMKMKFDKTATSPVPVWLPANGLAGQRFSTLMGYPVIPVQACSTLGDLGDIILADMSQYMLVQRGGGMQSDVSIHLHFDQAITAFRFIMRAAGQPWWEAPITPENATDTLSPFVTLAARS